MHVSEFLESQLSNDNQSNLFKSLRGQSLLITGAAGSIGSKLAELCLEANLAELILLDHSESGLFMLMRRLEFVPGFGSWVKPVIADIRNGNELEIKLGKSNLANIIHTAACKHVPLLEQDPYSALSVNVLGTANLADLALRRNTKHFLMLSTDKANNPCSLMGATKLIAEHALQEKAKIKSRSIFSSLRLPNILGSSGSVFQLFRNQIKRGRNLRLSHSQATRYFVHPDDAAKLILQALCLIKDSGRYLLNFGECIKIKDLAEWFQAQHLMAGGGPVRIDYVGLREGERLHECLVPKNIKLSKSPVERIFKIGDSLSEQVAWPALQRALSSSSEKEMKLLIRRRAAGLSLLDRNALS